MQAGLLGSKSHPIPSSLPSNSIPDGATAGIPFKVQPVVALVDKFKNPIEALNGAVMTVELMSEEELTGGELEGTTIMVSAYGLVSFTDLVMERIGAFWLKFSSNGYIAYSPTFEVVHGSATSVQFIVQPLNMFKGVHLSPQPVAQLRDPYQNMVLLSYAFKARIFKTRQDGTSVPRDTHITCPQCGGAYESHEFRSEEGYVKFSDLSVRLSPEGPENEFGLAIELIAVSLSKCEQIGDSKVCGSESEYIHGRQVYGISDYFNVYSVTDIKITSQPGDTNSSLTIMGQDNGNDIYPRVELYWTKRTTLGNTLFHAPVSSFVLEATLYYAGGRVGSQCLQSNSSQPCLGICESDNALCDRQCPKDLGNTGQQFTVYQGDSSHYRDSNGAFDLSYKGLELSPQVCTYQVVCQGTMGKATCSSLRINRAGQYYLLFRVPPCGLLSSTLPWVRRTCLTVDGQGPRLEKASRVFTILPLATTPGFLLTTCSKCEQPIQALVNRVFLIQPVVQLVDPSGNPVGDGMFYINVSIPSLEICTQLANDTDMCLPAAGRILTNRFDFMPMTSCSCLEGTLSVPVVSGYATFTDLKITQSLRRVKLMFYSSNGLHNFSSVEFSVVPRRPSALAVRQQPLIAQAGERIAFEVGLLDSFGFVSEHDFNTTIRASLVRSAPNGTAISCGTGPGLCHLATSNAGLATFSFYINQSGTNVSVSFQGELCGSGSCVEQVITCTAFTVLSATPDELLIIEQPSNILSQVKMTPTPSVLLLDSFGNHLSQDIPANLEHFIPDFRVGCDSIRLQIW